MKTNMLKLSLVLGLAFAGVTVFLVMADAQKDWRKLVTGKVDGTVVLSPASGAANGTVALAAYGPSNIVADTGLKGSSGKTLYVGCVYTIAELCGALNGSQTFGFISKASGSGSGSKDPMTAEDYLKQLNFQKLNGLSPNSGGNDATKAMTLNYFNGLSPSPSVVLCPKNPHDRCSAKAWFAYTHSDGKTYAVFLGNTLGN